MFCPICAGISTPKWGISFQKACNSVNTNEDFNPEIEYCECRTCGFIFASTMHSWTKEQFNDLVYNDKYTLVDPDHVIARAQNNAEFLDSTFKGLSTKPHLDYGGGTGKLSEFLRAKKWDSTSYDPFYNKSSVQGPFHFITAFEVFEHVPDIKSMMMTIRHNMSEDSVLLFSTLVTDCVQDINTWWYASPRNGHISLFSIKSLHVLANQYRLTFVSLNRNTHLMYKIQPKWLAPKININ